MISALGQKLTPRNPDCSNTQFVALKIPKVIKPTATELEDRNFALHESTTRSRADENMNKQRLALSRSLTLNVSENSNSVFWKYVILCSFWISFNRIPHVLLASTTLISNRSHMYIHFLEVILCPNYLRHHIIWCFIHSSDRVMIFRKELWTSNTFVNLGVTSWFSIEKLTCFLRVPAWYWLNERSNVFQN